jgi:hypothetical protein
MGGFLLWLCIRRIAGCADAVEEFEVRFVARVLRDHLEDLRFDVAHSISCAESFNGEACSLFRLADQLSIFAPAGCVLWFAVLEG